MVGLEVVVLDEQNNRLTGIPVSVAVKPSSDPLFGITHSYNLPPADTNAMGIADWSHVEEESQFIATANGSPDYGTGLCSTSTSITGGGFCEIVLKEVYTVPSSGGGITCKAGYEYDASTGECVQTATVGTGAGAASIMDWIDKYWYVFAIIVVVVVIGIVVMMIEKSKGKTIERVTGELKP